MQLNQFNGGLSTRIDPSLIGPTYAVICENVDTSAIVLKSAKDVLMTSTDMSQYFYKFGGVFYSSSAYRDYLEYRDALYYTEPSTRPKKVKNGVTYNMGIDKPVAVPAFDSSSNPIFDQAGKQYNGIVPVVSAFDNADIVYSFGTNSNGNVASGTVNYRFGIVQNGVVVRHIDATYTNGADQAITITFQPAGGLTLNVYRSYSSTYRYIGQVSLNDVRVISDTVNDISTNTAFSETSSSTYGVIQYTMTYYNDTTGIESAPMDFSSELTVKYGDRVQVTKLPLATDPQVTHRRVYRIGGNLTSMSLVKELNDNTTTSFYDYTDDVNTTTVLESYEFLPPPATIKYLVEAYGILFAADGKDLVFSMQGFPEYWPASNRINFDADITGLLPTPNGLLVSTRYKTWILVGTDVSQFAKLIVSDEQGCINHKTFKMVKNMPVWISLDGYCTLSNGLVSVISKDLLSKINLDVSDCVTYDEMYILALTDGSIMMFDTRYVSNFTTYTLAKDIISMGVFEDTLYCVSSENKLGTLFEGSNLSFTYKTGKFVDEIHSELKGYNNVYIRANGTFTVKIIIDDVLVQTHNITGNDTFDLTMPTDTQRGTGIQFEISGIGTVYEIEYKPIGRQNGR